MGGVAAGGQPGPPPDRHQPDPPVQGAHADLRPAQVLSDSGQGPRAPAGQQRGDPPGQPAPAQPGPSGPRPASPAVPSALNRLIQRRTVAGCQSSSSAICAAGSPFSDSSTITARAAWRHRPRRSACNRSISPAEPLFRPLKNEIYYWHSFTTRAQARGRSLSPSTSRSCTTGSACIPPSDTGPRSKLLSTIRPAAAAA
jgi:hypothetical protein